MKFILSLLLFAISASAADVVVVVSAMEVRVNGTNYGKPADAIANNKKLAPDIQRALEVWAAGEAKKLSDTQAKLDAANSRRTELVQMAKEKLSLLTPADRVIVSNVVYQASLPDEDAKRQALIKQRDDLQRKIDSLSN